MGNIIYRKRNPIVYTGIKEGLVGCWEFDETSGTTAYNSHIQIPRYHGIIDGATINQTGKIGKAYSFDGTDDLINLVYCKHETEFSFSAWVYPKSYGDPQGRIFEKKIPTTLAVGSYLAMYNPMYYSVKYATGERGWRFTHPGLNQWFHIVVVHDKSLYSNIPVVYINGSLVSLTLIYSGSGDLVINRGPYIIGNEITKQRTFDGYIDQVAIWNRLITQWEVEGIYNAGNGIAFMNWEDWVEPVEPPQDPDTSEDFFTITGITDATIQGAIETLVSDLRDVKIWNKMIAVYPVVGGSAGTHKYNLKDPRDADDAFRLDFSGTITHSANGMVSDGSTGWADTHLIPSSVYTKAGSIHVSYYSRNNTTGNLEEIGASDGVSKQLSLAIRYNNLFYTPLGTASPNASNTDSSGYFVASKYFSGQVSGYRNKTKLIDEATCGDGLVNKSLALLAWNFNGTIVRHSTRQCAFASIGYGLTQDEADTLHDIVQAFQTTLSRNI